MENTKSNSEHLLEMLEIYFDGVYFPHFAKVKEIICDMEFNEEEVELELFVKLYSKIVSQKDIINKTYHNGFKGCMLTAKEGSTEIRVIIEF